MKNIVFILLFTLTTPLLAQKYVLKDGSKRLVSFIENQIAQGDINKNPVIVINEVVVKAPYLEALSFSSEDIIGLFVIEKEKDQLTTIYGPQARNGVVSITTKIGKATNATFDQKDSNLLIYIDGIVATKEKMVALAPNDIESMNVIKDPKVIKTYTDQFYTGIIEITTKKN